MTHYKIIHDEEQIRKFHSEVLVPLKPLEVHFVSLSARSKYLTPEERKEFDLGRTEMFAKTIVRKDDADEYIKHIKRFECNVGGYTTKNGNPIPSKCLVCYANICNSSTVVALQKFQNLIAEYTTEAVALSMQPPRAWESRAQFVDRMNKIDNNLLTFYQNSHSSKYWIDIDIDLDEKKETDVANIGQSVESCGYEVTPMHLIDTKSGYHLLLPKHILKDNPSKIAVKIQEVLKAKEAVINKNQMVPLPGTIAAGHKVKFLELK